MNAIPAQDIKRRGISAVDEALKKGPVHVIKNNRPKYVILSAEDYRKLAPPTAEERQSVWDFLMNRPWKGHRSKADIDRQIKEERDSWGDR